MTCIHAAGISRSCSQAGTFLIAVALSLMSGSSSVLRISTAIHADRSAAPFLRALTRENSVQGTRDQKDEPAFSL